MECGQDCTLVTVSSPRVGVPDKEMIIYNSGKRGAEWGCYGNFMHIFSINKILNYENIFNLSTITRREGVDNVNRSVLKGRRHVKRRWHPPSGRPEMRHIVLEKGRDIRRGECASLVTT